MIRTLVIADSGATMAAITAALSAAVGVDIVAYASGTAPVTAVVRAARPDLVLVDEMHRPGLGARRIAEVHGGDSRIAIVGLTENVEGAWAADAFRAGASAVVPRGLEPVTLARVLHEAIAGPANGRLEAVPIQDRSAA